MTIATLFARSSAVAALMLAGQIVLAQTMYRVVPLPYPAQEPVAIDSRGRVLAANGQYTEFLICRKSSRCRALPKVRDRHSGWSDFNDEGVLAGFGERPDGTRWAVRKDPGQGGGVHFLTPGGAAAIAPDGAVVGGDGFDRAFLYTDHRIDLKGLPNERSVEATDINVHHVIAGRCYTTDNRAHAVVWIDAGLAQDLGMAQGHIGSGAWAINDAGVIVGYSDDPRHGWQPARFENGATQVFLLPHAQDNGMALSINAAGTIVGSFYNSRLNRPAGGIVEGDRMVDLNDRLRHEDARIWDIWSARRINDAGQIAANAVDLQGFGHAVLLEPIN